MAVNDMKHRIAALDVAVAARLSCERMLHVRGVRHMAERMAAVLFTPDELAEGDPSLAERVAAAALLHDVAKEESFEKQLQLVRRFGIMESEDEARRYKAVIHGMTAACLIPEEFPFYAIADVQEAVSWHTTGKPHMDVLGAIIFVADYIEDGRAYAASVAARRFFFDGAQGKSREEMKAHLDHTVFLILQQTIEYLTEKKRPIHPTTFATFDFYRQKLKTV